MGFFYCLVLISSLISTNAFSQSKQNFVTKPVIQYPDTDFFSKHYREHFLEKDQYYGKDEMNGISYSDFVRDFDKLTMITIKYRNDSNELRIVYGNDQAVKGIRHPEHKFETGAMIYKLAYPSISDPLFISSKTPGHGYVRYQAMKYDPTKYSTGWGYAIFGNDGKTFPGNPKETMDTCVACHDLAKERNYVFSVMMENPDPRKKVPQDREIFQNTFSWEPVGKNPDIITGQKIRSANKNISFETVSASVIPETIKNFIMQKSISANKLTGNILKKPFVAFMPEIVPLLINKTLENSYPSFGVVNKIKTFFVFTYIGSADESCQPGKTNLYYGVGYYRFGGAVNLLLNKKCFSNEDKNSFRSN